MKFAQPTPELKVPDVAAAQEYYRDHFGFDIAWYNTNGRIGAVSHGECAIFFREHKGETQPSVFWCFCEDLNVAHQTLSANGADIVDPPANKPWGLRQFTVQDAYGNLFHFFHDL